MIFVLICMAGIFWFLVKRDERKRIRAGYWAEHLSPGQLREDEKSFALFTTRGSKVNSFTEELMGRLCTGYHSRATRIGERKCRSGYMGKDS